MSRHASVPPRNTRHWAIAGSLLASLLVIVACATAAIALNRHPPEHNAAGSPPAARSPSAPSELPPLASSDLVQSFAAFQRETFGDAIAGLVVMPLGGEPLVVAPWNRELTAWSTIKVPLSIAAIRQGLGPQLDADITAALTVSDNDAAERIWAALGDGETAADKVAAVLDDPTTIVQAQRTRPPFTPFGQTAWGLENQVRFLSTVACGTDDAAKQVLTLMGQVASDTWGLGRIPAARFKGGWGPGVRSGYLVRQFGVLTDGAGAPTTVVAVIVEPESFEEGTSELSAVAQWLADPATRLPAGRCPVPQP